MVSWNRVEPLPIQKCFKCCGIANLDTDEPIQEVEVFENLTALAPAVRDELSLVTEAEYVAFDDNVQCSEVSGKTRDEIAEIIVAEALDLEAGPSNVLPAPDEEDEDEIQEIELPNRFAIENNQDMKDILQALETYCSRNDSISLPLCYQLRSNFEAECAEKKRVAQSRMLQPTLDSFFSRLSKE